MEIFYDFKNIIFFALVIIIVFIINIVFFIILNKSNKNNDLINSDKSLDKLHTDILARLSSLIETSSASQTQLSTSLNYRLDNLSNQVNESLNLNSNKTSESLGELKKHLSKIDEAQKNIYEISNDITSLQNILSNKQARGAYGEVQLNDIISNILPPTTYSFQHMLSNGTKPDCILKLPNPPGMIAVDAKFPLENFQNLKNANTEDQKNKAIRLFASDVLTHIKNIKEKYIIPGETAESAIMFIPSESVYSEIYTSLTNVVNESFKSRIWIVSPTTIWALLNTIRAVLKDVNMKEQAHIIQTEVRLLYKDLERLDSRAEKLQRHFLQATNDINDIRKSSEKIMTRGEKMENIQLETKDKNKKNNGKM
ncbi:DNA recombination protein RmuC [Alphaproteobacteria bacterium]|nr:DNA recombination protein RmuC [Alphaproteobacteria bacterium]